MSTTPTSETISVIICAYTQRRWTELLGAVQSVAAQSIAAHEILVVIDHNDTLYAHAQAALPHTRVIRNDGPKGLSGARNSGVAAAQGSIIAFLDDDAVAAVDWLEKLLEGYSSSKVLGVGGSATPIWPARRVAWFPAEFDWVIGCSHRGTPERDAYVRNFIGCNMSFRRETLARVGTFRTDVGRVGTYPAGCEETELCIRIQQNDPSSLLLYRPAAQVAHHVTEERLTLRYFVQRCFAEGRSKALVSRAVGRQDSLSSEWDYTLRVLPHGVKRSISEALTQRDPAALGRAGGILFGLATTVAGYLLEGAIALTQRATTQRSTVPQEEHLETSFSPARIVELNLAEPLADLSGYDPATGKHYMRAFALVRWHSRPLGFTELELGTRGIPGQELTARLKGQFNDVLQAAQANEAQGRTPAAGTPAPFVSVVIATHNRTESLATCLRSLEQLDYPDFEVVVVDNAPSTPDTFELLKTFDTSRFRYVREDTPGLAVAHNRGLGEARGELIAFTDDDVRVDRYWLRELVAGFGLAEDVGCVTGMIVPAEMETTAQAWLEQYGGFNKGFEVSRFNLSDHRPANPLYPYTAGVFGSGANMAFSREALERIGGFDPALGAGSKGVGGDDLAAFFDIVEGGFTLVYQPAAIVHHWHRRDYLGLQRQAYGYGVGLTAFLMKVVIDQPRRLLNILPLVPRAVVYALSPKSPKNAKKRVDYPQELSQLERKGMLYGPLAYIQSRWQRRKVQPRA